MAPSGQLTSPALQALLQDGKLAGSWTLDTTRSQVRLQTGRTWGLRPLHGAFRQVTGNGAVTADGDASGVITVAAGSIPIPRKCPPCRARSCSGATTRPGRVARGQRREDAGLRLGAAGFAGSDSGGQSAGARRRQGVPRVRPAHHPGAAHLFRPRSSRKPMTARIGCRCGTRGGGSTCPSGFTTRTTGQEEPSDLRGIARRRHHGPRLLPRIISSTGWSAQDTPRPRRRPARSTRVAATVPACWLRCTTWAPDGSRSIRSAFARTSAAIPWPSGCCGTCSATPPANVARPLADLPADFEAQLDAMGY